MSAPKRTKASGVFPSLIHSGLAEDGAVLRYRTRGGKLCIAGRLRPDGIEIAQIDGTSKIVGTAAFEQLGGSTNRRPSEFTILPSGLSIQQAQRVLADSGFLASQATLAAGTNPSQPLLEDEHDEFCYICGEGGDLMCCETCPATFHARCMGMSAIPEDNWHCPACRCIVCGGIDFDARDHVDDDAGRIHYMTCSRYVSPFQKPGSLVLTHSTCAISGTAAASHIVNADMDRANHDNMEHDKIDQQQQQVKAASPLPFRLVSPSAAEFDPGEGVPPVLQIDREAGPPLKKNPKPEPVSSGHVSSDDEFEPAGVVDAMLPPKSRQDRLQQHSKIYLKTQGLLRCSCVGTGALVHFRCLPVEVRSAVSQCSTQAVYLNRSIAYACAKMAKICCDGAVQVDTLADGTSLMFQLVHCAAATAETASCCGVVPGYTFSIRQELRRTLSAAYYVLKASYATLLDSRTGADVLPWLLRGARLADGALDLSQFYAGILFAGTTVVSVACLRLLVDGIAEVPVLATRPELRSNRLGERLLARIESVLHKAGTRRIFTPAFAKPGLPCTALHVPGIDSGNVALDSAADTKVAGYVPPGPPLLMQSAWGYELASRTDMRDVAKTKMLRFPGVFLAVKRLCSSHDVLTPRSLPGSLKWNADIPWHATSALAAHDMVKILPKHQPDVANIFASAIPPSAPQATQQHENFIAPELTLVQQHFNEQLSQNRQDQGFGRAPKRSVLEQQRHVAVGTASAPLESVVVGFAPRRVAIPAVPAPCYSGKVVLDLNLQTQPQPHITVATQPNGLAADGRGQHFGAPVAPHLQVASPDFMARQAALAQRLLAWQVAKRDGSGAQ